MKKYVGLLLILCFLMSVFTVAGCADYTLQIGQPYSFAIWTPNSGEYINTYDSYVDFSTIPGMYGNIDEQGVYLMGVPIQAGTYFISGDVGCKYNDTPDFSSMTKLAITVIVQEGSGALKVTVKKSPTSETVYAGESAMFISAAENYSQLEWRVVTPDGSNCWRNKTEIEMGFPGVRYEAYKATDGREVMVLYDIPLSMNGYYIQTKFWSLDGNEKVFTNDRSCYLTVLQPKVSTPVFISHPADTGAELGQGVLLSAAATVQDGFVTYQWYSGTGRVQSGSPISGATGANYQVPQISGTRYYFCAARTYKDGQYSDPVYSDVAAVTYAQPTVTPVPAGPTTPGMPATPVPQPADPTAAPSTAAPTADPNVPSVPSPSSQPAAGTEPAAKDYTPLYVGAAVICVLAVCATIIIVKK